MQHFAAMVRTIVTATPRSDVRRTRVVATIGPASSDPATVAAMVAAGMDVARLPLAHGSIDEAIARLRMLRSVAPEIGVLADLPGPKVRAASFPEAVAVRGRRRPDRAGRAPTAR